ncbi:sensor histidine kinase [Nocardioides ferulae]|uniref:sensor histidine kinase n=1 Tax=Nocardioides ferulae TaxID=2340821 RepID=UPI0019812B3D|nr:histidine kinase [Nocardioides ferulae]
MPSLLAPITTVHPAPVDQVALVERLRLTLVSAGQFLLFVPALVLFVLTVVAVPTGPAGVGFVLAAGVVPATALLASWHRRLAGGLLGEPVPAGYADTAGRGLLGRPLVWLRDGNRWRDVGFLAYSTTGGAILSALPPLLLLTPVVHLAGLLIDPGRVWALTFGLSLVCPLVWWLVTPPLVRARTLADRAILGHSLVAQLERRVAQVAATRTEALDANAAEVRRIERDLHDGAQARIAAVGMNVGLAEKLIASDPAAAAELLREARETTVSALEDLRSVVRGIHPPVLADRGLPGAVEALALSIPLPVTLALDVPESLPAPVESAAYFAVAECLANTVKHAAASRAWVSGAHQDERLRLVVGDDGVGGADPAGSGLAGVARRLAAFDGSMTVSSPAGGPTVVTLEVPCPTTPTSPGSAPS